MEARTLTFAGLVEEPSDVYLANPAFSASKIRAIKRSPLHYKTEYIDGIRDEETPAMRYGKIIHAAILEPKRFRKYAVIEPVFVGKNKKDGTESTSLNNAEVKEKRAHWYECLAPENIVLKASEVEQISGLLRSVETHTLASKLLTDGVAERSIYFKDPVTGVDCKMRPDMITSDGYILDLKTCEDASHAAFTREIWNRRYDITAAFYSYGFRQHFGMDPRGFVFIVVEKSPPYAVAVFIADDTVTEKGTLDFRAALELFKLCETSNAWPGYFNGEAQNISLPLYAMNE